MERIIVQRKSAGDINAVVQKRSELQELTKRADALRADRKQHAKMLGSCTDPADRERAIQRGTVRSASASHRNAPDARVLRRNSRYSSSQSRTCR